MSGDSRIEEYIKDKTEEHLKDMVERAIESLINYRIALSKEELVDVVGIIEWPVPE